MRSLKIEKMTTSIRLIKTDDSIVLSNNKSKLLGLKGHINELLLIFEELMAHTSELDRDLDFKEGDFEFVDKSSLLEIEKYRNYIDFEIEESFDFLPYVTYVFMYEVNKNINIENPKKEVFHVGLTIRKAIQDRVFKMKVLTKEQRVACINIALEEIEYYLKSEPYEFFSLTHYAAYYWVNYLRAHAVAIANDFEGEVPFPAPTDWTPEKVILNAESFEIASCIYKILVDNDSLYKVNLNKMSKDIQEKFYLPGEKHPKSGSIRFYLTKLRNKERSPKLPENSNEIIEKITSRVKRFINRDRIGDNL